MVPEFPSHFSGLSSLPLSVYPLQQCVHMSFIDSSQNGDAIAVNCSNNGNDEYDTFVTSHLPYSSICRHLVDNTPSPPRDYSIVYTTFTLHFVSFLSINLWSKKKTETRICMQNANGKIEKLRFRMLRPQQFVSVHALLRWFMNKIHCAIVDRIWVIWRCGWIVI